MADRGARSGRGKVDVTVVPAMANGMLGRSARLHPPSGARVDPGGPPCNNVAEGATPLRSFATHLECAKTGKTESLAKLANVSSAGKPFWVRYDLEALRRDRAFTKQAVAARPSGMWKWHELLPVGSTDPDFVPVSLGECETPLVALGSQLWVKDEGRLPTASFKSRGLAMAVNRAVELGAKSVAMATAGNAGSALSAYASAAGLSAYVFCPSDTPETVVAETRAQGAHVFPVSRPDGTPALINECGAIVAAGADPMGWFAVNTLKEPYRIEGKKTMGLELAEQFGYDLPDVILYPTGGGTGLIGMWKAFQELLALGWLPEGAKLPKMVAVQSSGCAPIVRAWQRGEDEAELWVGAATCAPGIRVPVAIGDFMILNAVRESGGWAAAVDDAEIPVAVREVAHATGLLLCPEGGACFAAYKAAVADGRIKPSDRVVLFNCAAGIKYAVNSVPGDSIVLTGDIGDAVDAVRRSARGQLADPPLPLGAGDGDGRSGGGDSRGGDSVAEPHEHLKSLATGTVHFAIEALERVPGTKAAWVAAAAATATVALGLAAVLLQRGAPRRS